MFRTCQASCVQQILRDQEARQRQGLADGWLYNFIVATKGTETAHTDAPVRKHVVQQDLSRPTFQFWSACKRCGITPFSVVRILSFIIAY